MSVNDPKRTSKFARQLIDYVGCDLLLGSNDAVHLIIWAIQRPVLSDSGSVVGLRREANP